MWLGGGSSPEDPRRCRHCLEPLEPQSLASGVGRSVLAMPLEAARAQAGTTRDGASSSGCQLSSVTLGKSHTPQGSGFLAAKWGGHLPSHPSGLLRRKVSKHWLYLCPGAGRHRTTQTLALEVHALPGFRPTVTLCSDVRRTSFDRKCLVNSEVSCTCRASISTMAFLSFFRMGLLLFTPRPSVW